MSGVEGSHHPTSGDLEGAVRGLLERLEEGTGVQEPWKLQPAKLESRSLQFWRSILSECLASFYYVFAVCGAAAAVASGGSTAQTILAAALASGFSVAALTHSFQHISGAHINPAVSLAMLVTRRVSLLRGIMFIAAQCGGGIAGAALLYGVTVPGRQSTLSATVAQLPSHLSAWERFGLELILTFLVVFTFLVSLEKRAFGTTPLTVGAAYLSATIVSMPYLNPARALGPAFVMNKWDNHWVFWFGPMLGGVIAGLIYEFVFNTRRHFKRSKDSIDGDSSSIHSDEDTYDELDKPRSTYNTLRPIQPGADLYRPVATSNPSSGPILMHCGVGYCGGLNGGLYTTGAPGGGGCKIERVESLYGGTKSLYCKSPPLTRANLNRSQSVYSKTGGSGGRQAGISPGVVGGPEGLLPRPGPLVPAQSLYPMRLNSVSSSSSAATTTQCSPQNQNQQNLQRLNTDPIYAHRPSNQPIDRIYRKLPGRPESVYTQRQESNQENGYYQSSQGGQGGRCNYAVVNKGGPPGGYERSMQGGGGCYQGGPQQQQQQQQQGVVNSGGRQESGLGNRQDQGGNHGRQQDQGNHGRQEQQDVVVGLPPSSAPPPYHQDPQQY